jgi:hypothetical protein
MREERAILIRGQRPLLRIDDLAGAPRRRDTLLRAYYSLSRCHSTSGTPACRFRWRAMTNSRSERRLR